MSIVHTTDHAARALARLAQQYKGKTKIEAIFNALTAQTQALEDALYQLLTERYIEPGVGVQLDVIGKIIGQPREFATDDQYKLRLKARVRANRSCGTVEDILAVFIVLFETLDDLRLEQFFPAGLTLHLEDHAILDDDAVLYAGFLKASRAAGVDAQFHYSEYDAGNTFTLPRSTTLSQGFTSPYPTSMKVVSTAGFPAAGYVIVDYASAGTQMIFAYTSKTEISFEGVVGWEGGFDDFNPGTLVLAVPTPVTLLADPFSSPFPGTMIVQDTSSFPSSGQLTIRYGFSDRRVFYYTGKTSTTFTGVTAGGGTGVTFGEEAVVVGGPQELASTSQPGIGGRLSSVLRA